jgi:hypothetical protein
VRKSLLRIVQKKHLRAARPKADTVFVSKLMQHLLRHNVYAQLASHLNGTGNAAEDSFRSPSHRKRLTSLIFDWRRICMVND